VGEFFNLFPLPWGRIHSFPWRKKILRFISQVDRIFSHISLGERILLSISSPWGERIEVRGSYILLP